MEKRLFHLSIIDEEFNYEDMSLYFIDDDNIKFCYTALIIIICTWKVSEYVNRDDDNFIEFYFPIFWEGILEYVDSIGLKVDMKKVDDVFLNNNNNSPDSIISSPFLKLKNGKVFGIKGMCKRMDWSLFVRKRIIVGGEISRKYGAAFEESLEFQFEEHQWKVLGKGVKVKNGKEIITDCDLIVFRNGLLLFVQAKAITRSKSLYDQWCCMNTVNYGVEQANKCKKSFNVREFEHIHNIEVEQIESIVVTANYLINGIIIDDVPVMSFNYLISLLGGAVWSVLSTQGDENKIIKKYLPKEWKASDFIKLIREPFEWEVDLKNIKISKKYKKIDKYLFEIPMLIEEDFSIEKWE